MKVSHVVTHLQRHYVSFLLAGSLLANVGLAITLQHERDRYTGRSRLANQIGLTVGSFVGQDVNGKQLEVSARSDLPTIFYVFGVHCRYCEKNFENANALARAVKGRYRFVGVSVIAEKEEFAQYNQEHAMAYDVVNVNEETAARMHFDVTPKTYALSQSGQVLQVWRGAWGQANRSSVEKYFGVHLPNALDTTGSSERAATTN